MHLSSPPQTCFLNVWQISAIGSGFYTVIVVGVVGIPPEN